MPLTKRSTAICDAVRKTYGHKGEAVVEKKLRAIGRRPRKSARSASRQSQSAVGQEDGEAAFATADRRPPAADSFLSTLLANRGDDLPVSAMSCDGTFPTGTARFEKRNLALEIPVWEAASCIQCGKCAMVCPHAAIRIKAYDESLVGNAPPTFKSLQPIHKDWKGLAYTIQVAPEDCRGARSASTSSPPHQEHAGPEVLVMAPAGAGSSRGVNWDYFLPSGLDRPTTIPR